MNPLHRALLFGLPISLAMWAGIGALIWVALW
jgi:hypothetical protein